MKILFSIIAFVFFICSYSQEKERIVFNPVKENQEELFRHMYQYPQFVSGQAFYKDGSVVEAKFNYNCLTSNIEFIDPKGDTLSLAHGNNFSKISIQTDTFYFYNKIFIKQLTHYPVCNLLVKHYLKYSGSEKKDSYGGYSETNSNSSIKIISNGNSIQKLAADENMFYTFRDYYYLSGRFSQFYPATKKGLFDLFPKKQNELKEFLTKNKIDFDKTEDLEKLVQFVQSLM